MKMDAHVDAHEDDPRKLLGSLLRQARTDAGLTQDSIGHAVGVDRSGVARTEGGGRSLTAATLGTWLERCGTTGLAADGIRAMWRVARRYGDNDAEPVRIWFVGWTDAEGTAHMLRYWQQTIVMGIAQTERYAYEVYRATGHSHERAVEATTARLERQQVLGRDDPPTVVIVLDEWVLHREIGSRDVMAEQCEKLLQLAELPNVLVQVVRGASPGLGGPVSLASRTGKPDTLLMASLLEDVVTTDTAQVRASAAIFEHVRGVAANIAESKDTIQEAHRRWTT